MHEGTITVYFIVRVNDWRNPDRIFKQIIKSFGPARPGQVRPGQVDTSIVHLSSKDFLYIILLIRNIFQFSGLHNQGGSQSFSNEGPGCRPFANNSFCRKCKVTYSTRGSLGLGPFGPTLSSALFTIVHSAQDNSTS